MSPAQPPPSLNDAPMSPAQLWPSIPPPFLFLRELPHPSRSLPPFCVVQGRWSTPRSSCRLWTDHSLSPFWADTPFSAVTSQTYCFVAPVAISIVVSSVPSRQVPPLLSLVRRVVASPFVALLAPETDVAVWFSLPQSHRFHSLIASIVSSQARDLGEQPVPS
jgi:hypothetical protein